MVKPNIKSTILTILSLFTIQMMLATDYYCDPVNGKASNDGSQNNPWGALEVVFEKGERFNAGDIIFLLSGNHGNVKVIGENEKYVKIIGAKGEQPIINSVVFGSENIAASKWSLENIFFKNAPKELAVLIFENSSRIRLLSNQFISENSKKSAIYIAGNQCKIESNTFFNYRDVLTVYGQKNQIRNNRIENFYQNAIRVSGNYNLFEYNLIKESYEDDDEVNNGFFFSGETLKGNVLRGNTIINLISAQREKIGWLNGIFSENSTISETIIENNVIVSSSENGISFNGNINNSKIVNNTVVNPYFGMEFGRDATINFPLSIKIIGTENSSGLIIRNNLTNNLVFESIKGIADYNLIVPVGVHAYDLCFKNWALFDFSLGENSQALNNGTSELAPEFDASLNKRSLGNFVNIGAFEFTKIDEREQVITIKSEISDRQIHSKGKGDWDGQPQIRVGGVGEGFDGAGVFPFKLPSIPGGKEILSINFKVFLTGRDNRPQGGIDLYGLAPKSNFWVTEDMFYQGTFGQDINARPIQNNYVGDKHFGGEIEVDALGKKEMKSYITTVFENGSKAGDYIFLRINPNAKDITDYHRWNFVSANSDKKDKHPKLEIIVGYPELKKGVTSEDKNVLNTITVSSNPVVNGDVSFYFLGFDQNKQVELKLLNLSGEQVYEYALNLSDVASQVFRTENLGLPTGKYLFEYKTEMQTKKKVIFVW